MTATAKTCTLRAALGEPEACPGADCPMWDDGTCVLDPVRPELMRSHALACHLVDLRVALESAKRAEDDSRDRSRFYRRLNRARVDGA